MRYSLLIKLVVLSITCVFAQVSDISYVEVPEPSKEALSYYKSDNVLWVINLILGFLIPLFFLFTGLSAKIRSWAMKLGRNKWFFTLAFYFIIFSIISFFIDFPIEYYQGFIREHAYNLSNQTFTKWFIDTINSLLVETLIGGLFICIPYFLLKKSPKRWWIYTSIVMVPFMAFIMFIAPIWIAPIFNDFGPMQNKKLEARILSLAEAANIDESRVFEVNKSVDTKKLNAYMTGFHNTKRIVLWDTIIEKLDEEELLFVMAHEMGHYILGHTINAIIMISLIMTLTFYAIHRTAGAFINRFKNYIGFEKLSDIASLPLLFMLMHLFLNIGTPIQLSVSRYQEHEADRFALEITQNNHVATTAFVKLQEENLAISRPGWLYKFWRASHPTLGDRIDFANSYHPWKERKPLKYENYFRHFYILGFAEMQDL